MLTRPCARLGEVKDFDRILEATVESEEKTEAVSVSTIDLDGRSVDYERIAN